MSLKIYDGPSAFDGRRIIAALVLASSNRKTGRMAQLHIMRADVEPHRATQSGDDYSVCGRCPFRPTDAGGCYVVTCQGPLSLWRALEDAPTAGAAEVARALHGVTLRFGAYGDPAALPAWLPAWLARLTGPANFTGYTHGRLTLGDAGVEHLRPVCMASVESPEEARRLQGLGWRTFRTRAPGAPLMAGEIDCPSPRVSCADCRLCAGSSRKAKSISIEIHGSRASRALRVVTK